MMLFFTGRTHYQYKRNKFKVLGTYPVKLLLFFVNKRRLCVVVLYVLVNLVKVSLETNAQVVAWSYRQRRGGKKRANNQLLVYICIFLET